LLFWLFLLFSLSLFSLPFFTDRIFRFFARRAGFFFFGLDFRRDLRTGDSNSEHPSSELSSRDDGLAGCLLFLFFGDSSDFLLESF
jgi:hypothetical protein